MQTSMQCKRHPLINSKYNSSNKNARTLINIPTTSAWLSAATAIRQRSLTNSILRGQRNIQEHKPARISKHSNRLSNPSTRRIHLRLLLHPLLNTIVMEERSVQASMPKVFRLKLYTRLMHIDMKFLARNKLNSSIEKVRTCTSHLRTHLRLLMSKHNQWRSFVSKVWIKITI